MAEIIFPWTLKYTSNAILKGIFSRYHIDMCERICYNKVKLLERRFLSWKTEFCSVS